jgi:hypothetical protein
VIAKVRKNWQKMRKEEAQKFDVERFNRRKLNEVEFRKEYQINISKSSAALDILSDGEEINRFWGNLKENIKTSVQGSLGPCELKQHKS